jgi:N-acetylglutamate synthase-like GNAT family acetyltransferase
MHNLAFALPAAHPAPSSAPASRPSLRPRRKRGLVPRIRMAELPDVAAIVALVNGFADEGLMLHRTHDDVARELNNFVVAVAPSGKVLACAALTEFSPSLAEVSSVAVHGDAHGQGLGTRVVMAVERVARLREIHEIFAMSLSDRFFLGLGYEHTDVARYPEKVARYDAMRADGREIVPKSCFRKNVGCV